MSSTGSKSILGGNGVTHITWEEAKKLFGSNSRVDACISTNTDANRVFPWNSPSVVVDYANSDII